MGSGIVGGRGAVGIERFLHGLPQSGAGPEEAGLDGPDRDPKDLADLAVVEALEVAKDQDRPHGRFEPGQAPQQEGPHLRLFDAVSGGKFPPGGEHGDPRGVPPGCWLVEGPVAAETLPPQVAETAVHRHPDDPGAQRGAAVIAREPLHDADQRVLGEIPGRLAVAEHPMADRVDPPLVAPEQLAQRRGVPSSVGLEELHLVEPREAMRLGRIGRPRAGPARRVGPAAPRRLGGIVGSENAGFWLNRLGLLRLRWDDRTVEQ